MILIVVRHRVRPEHVEDFVAQVAPFTAATLAEPGNISFEWTRSTVEPDVYVLIEAFQDAAAGQAHVSTDHFKAAAERLPDLLVEAPEIVYCDIPATGWSRMAEFKSRS